MEGMQNINANGNIFDGNRYFKEQVARYEMANEGR